MKMELTEQEVAHLQALVGEIPFKHASGLVQFLNGVVQRQQREAAVAAKKDEIIKKAVTETEKAVGETKAAEAAEVAAGLPAKRKRARPAANGVAQR